MHVIPMDYLVHFSLELVGGGVGVYAYRFCGHNIHRAIVWFVLTAITTFITVQVVG